ARRRFPVRPPCSRKKGKPPASRKLAPPPRVCSVLRRLRPSRTSRCLARPRCSENRSQKPGVRSQKSEVRKKKPCLRKRSRQRERSPRSRLQHPDPCERTRFRIPGLFKGTRSVRIDS